MKDPNDFTISFKDAIEAIETRLREGVEQAASTTIFFKRGQTRYQLPGDVFAVTRVSLLSVTNPQRFVEAQDYNFDAVGQQLVWLDTGAMLNDGAPLSVEYTTLAPPSGLTDFNPGSVVGTLVRAFARELTSLYAQMDQAYRRAFIDQASGVVLDNVVALLGVTRNPAQKATGQVTFSLKKNAKRPIPKGTRVAVQNGPAFVTVEEGLTQNAVGSVTVNIEAVEPGPDGNVAPGAIKIMPTPPSGVDGVTNLLATKNGLDAESDVQLRDRAKHWLERSGNATLNAIKFAVLDVDGVQGVEVLDHQRDDSIPLGEVRVRYSGGDYESVRLAVEQTRAAGVMVQLSEVVTIFISGDFFLIPGTQAAPDAAGRFLKAATDAIEALPIGAPLAVRRLNSLVYNIAGLAEVAEAKLSFLKGQDSLKDVTDPKLVERTEMIRPNKAKLNAFVLTALNATENRKAGANFEIDLQLLYAAGTVIQAAPFRNFTIDLNVSMRATLTDHPDQTPDRIGGFTRAVTFNSATAKLTIKPSDLAGFKPNEHKKEIEFVITAAAYPGLGETKRKFDITV